MKLRWLEIARTDIHHIHTYIAQHNPQAALHTRRNIVRAAQSLLDMPYAGRAGNVPQTREWIVADLPYIIVYRDVPGYIDVLRVFHAKQEIGRYQ